MVQKIYPHHMSQMEKDILREKQNIFYCMNPAVSVVCIPRRMIWIFAILDAGYYRKEWVYQKQPTYIGIFEYIPEESRWAGKHHVLHDAFRSTATCRGGLHSSSSSFLFFQGVSVGRKASCPT